MLDLVVSIVNHNSVEPLMACLASVFASQTSFTYRVYVVDNLCEQRAEAMVREAYPEVELIVNQLVLGFAANQNQVLRQSMAQCRYVLILNPDAFVSPTTIQCMLEFMESHEDMAICGPRLLNRDGESKKPVSKALSLQRDTVLLCLYVLGISRSLFQRILAFPQRHFIRRSSARAEGPDHIAPPQGPRVVYCEAVEGSCMLVRTEMLQRTGLFDERFFMYFEEVDLCLRARLDGWQIGYLSGPEVLHTGAYSTRRSYLNYLIVFARSCLLFYGKHQGRMAVWILRTSILITVAANMARWSVHYATKPSQRQEASAWLVFSKDLLKVAFQPF